MFWGKLEGKKEFRTFGFDRIHELEISNKKFERDKKLDPAKVFGDTIGLIYTSESPKEIVLQFSSLMGRYIKTLPLHHSQKIMEENEQGIKFKYFLCVNPELKSIILSYADEVKVISPNSLIKEIHSMHKKAAKRYS